LSEYVPARQAVHTPSRACPVPAEYFPTPQLVQSSALPMRFSLQLPAGHAKHCQTPESARNYQEITEKGLTTLVPLAANRPLAQSEHALDPLTAEIKPMGHATHPVAPLSSPNDPAPHCWHSALLFLSL
jgi:hypothetical protein